MPYAVNSSVLRPVSDSGSSKVGEKFTPVNKPLDTSASAIATSKAKGMPSTSPVVFLYQNRSMPYRSSKCARKCSVPIRPRTVGFGGCASVCMKDNSLPTHSSCPSKPERRLISGSLSQTLLALALADKPRKVRTKSRSKGSSPPLWASAIWLKMSFLKDGKSYQCGDGKSVGKNLRNLPPGNEAVGW